MSLSISQLVQKGKNHVETVYIKEINDNMKLSPLSRREWGEVEDIQTIAMKNIENIQTAGSDNKGWKERQREKYRKEEIATKLKMTMNVHDQTIQARKAQTRAIFLSAGKNDPELTEEAVEELKPVIFEEIYSKVLEISGIATDEEEKEEMDVKIEKFPEDK